MVGCDDLPNESHMKPRILLSIFAGLIALASPVRAQSQPDIKFGVISLNDPIRGELSYYQLDGQRWVVAALTQESSRYGSRSMQAPSPFLITCSKEQISISGLPLFSVDKLPAGDAYEDVVAVSFCTEMHKSFGVRLPVGF